MVLMEMSIFPMGEGESVSRYVARCIEVIRASGLDYELHAMGTIVEGELPQVLEVMQNCFDALAVDCDRITCTAKLDYRRDHRGRIHSKVASVENKLKPSSDQKS